MQQYLEGFGSKRKERAHG